MSVEECEGRSVPGFPRVIGPGYDFKGRGCLFKTIGETTYVKIGCPDVDPGLLNPVVPWGSSPNKI